MKREKILVPLFLIMLGPLFFPCISSAQDLCNSCLSTAWPACDSKCKRAETRDARASCIRLCATRQCQKECNYPEEDHGLDEAREDRYLKGDVPCDYCLRAAAKFECGQKCQNSADVVSCQENCAKRRCAHNCQLPDRPRRSTGAAKDNPERDCTRCKQSAEAACISKCGGTGAKRRRNTACEVSCVHEECFETCRPELF